MGGYHETIPRSELDALLSAERLDTYKRYASAWQCEPVELYLLGVELAASYMTDLSQEVVLRNAMHEQLAATYGPLHKAFPQSGGRRVDVHAVAHPVYALRNRVAHHEPVIGGVRKPGTAHGTPDAYRSALELHSDIVTLVRWISEPVGDWLARHSRTPDLLP